MFNALFEIHSSAEFRCQNEWETRERNKTFSYVFMTYANVISIVHSQFSDEEVERTRKRIIKMIHKT